MITIDIDKVRNMTGVDDISDPPKKGQVSNSQIDFYNLNAYNIVKTNTRFNLQEVEKTELRDGNDEQYLILRNYPVGEVSLLKIDDDEEEDYFLYGYAGKLVLKDGKTFVSGRQNIEITYKYYDSEQIDIIQTLIFYMVCIDVLIDAGNEKSEGIKNHRFKDYQMSFEGQPYGAQIQTFQNVINSIHKSLGKKVGISVL